MYTNINLNFSKVGHDNPAEDDLSSKILLSAMFKNMKSFIVVNGLDVDNKQKSAEVLKLVGGKKNLVRLAKRG